MIWRLRFDRYICAEALEDGQRVPWYLGYAWYLPYSDRAYYLPMPINWIAAWTRSLWIRARKARVRDELVGLYHYGYNRGHRAGRQAGYDFALRCLVIKRRAKENA